MNRAIETERQPSNILEAGTVLVVSLMIVYLWFDWTGLAFVVGLSITIWVSD